VRRSLPRPPPAPCSGGSSSREPGANRCELAPLEAGIAQLVAGALARLLRRAPIPAVDTAHPAVAATSHLTCIAPSRLGMRRVRKRHRQRAYHCGERRAHRPAPRRHQQWRRSRSLGLDFARVHGNRPPPDD
jgi:hypothetical protein